MIDPKLTTLSSVLERADSRLRDPERDVHLWPTGFDILDEVIGGGLRAGTLNLISGPQGQGKTMLTLQIARSAVLAGRSALFFSYELDADSLVQRLVAMEAGELGDSEAPKLSAIRATFEGQDGSWGGLDQRFAHSPYGLAGLQRVMTYSDRLAIHRSTHSHTGMGEINNAVKDFAGVCGEAPLVVIDYLQKVGVPHVELSEEERITRVTEELKDLAIEFGCPVLAIAASDRDGLEPGSRMRARNMRGSTALAYEADIVLILSTKSDIVARHHLVYDPGSIERFRDWSVITVEKNRSGHGGAEIELRKRFDQGRFEPHGRLVGEKLIDERLYTE